MPRRTHRKRALLFLAAVLLPSAVLVGTTLRLIRQQRELAARRVEEERALLALRVGQDLFEELRGLSDRLAQYSFTPEGIGGITGSEPSVLTLAAVKEGRLVYPWEMHPDPAALLDPTTVVRYQRLVERGGEAEYRVGDPVEAARLYGLAAEGLEGGNRGDAGFGGSGDRASHAAQRLLAEARVDQARALLRAHQIKEAQAAFLLLAESPPSLADTEGMPFSIYGLEGLHQSGTGREHLLRLLEETLGNASDFSLPALLAWRDVAQGIVGEGGEESASELLRGVEEAVAERAAVLGSLEELRRDFSGLSATALRTRGGVGEGAGNPTWIPYGSEPWLVGVLAGVENGPTRVAVVRPAPLLGVGAAAAPPRARTGAVEGEDDDLRTARQIMRFLPAGDVAGESLGPALNGLRASFPSGFPPPPEQGDVEVWFFRLLLPIILILTGFTAYLAWRDVKREAEAVRLRSQFVSSVTHELKTPLTSIRMFAETLRLGRHTGPEAQQEYLDTVVHETERLSRLINNVLDFARIDRGEKTYHMASTDVATAAREAARVVAYPLAQGGYDLTMEIAEDIPLVEADADALTQALLNLLSNAIKFSPEGSRIDLRVLKRGDELLLQVGDQGRGIASGDREAIFRDFFRTPEVEREGIPGTGLGLALVAHVARAHGGWVEVESDVGRGSTFTIRIPVERNARNIEGRGRTHGALTPSMDSQSGEHSDTPDSALGSGLHQEGTP